MLIYSLTAARRLVLPCPHQHDAHLFICVTCSSFNTGHGDLLSQTRHPTPKSESQVVIQTLLLI